MSLSHPWSATKKQLLLTFLIAIAIFACNNNNNNFIYRPYYFTIKIEYLQKKQLSDLPIGRAHANI